MIDFNTCSPPPPGTIIFFAEDDGVDESPAAAIDLNGGCQGFPKVDWHEVRERLAATASAWLPPMYPHGRLSPDRKTLRCANLAGDPPRNEGSCVIHLAGTYAGWGFDHATGEKAGPIDLIALATGLTGRGLFEEVLRLAGMDQPTPPARLPPPKPDHSLEIRRTLDGCIPLAGTVADAYLKARGLADPGCPDLLFHPDLTDYDSRSGWPGMVAVVRNGAGQPTGGIHRTFLLEDGSGKAPPGKKMLGPVSGGCVRLTPLGEDGRIGIAEGIETALSATRIFGIPTWAGLSADGVRKFQWPDGVRHVTIFPDAGDVGMQASATLSDRLNVAGIESEVIAPRHGDDFNDDLSKGATAADYRAPSDAMGPPAWAVAEEPPTAHTFEDIQAAALKLTFPPDMAALASLLEQLARTRLDPVAERQVLVAIKATARIPVSVTEKQIRDLRRQLGMAKTGAPTIRPPWFSQLRTGADGAPERNEANVITALSNDKAFAGTLVFDEFRQEILVNRPLAWDDTATESPRRWLEADDVRCAEWMQRRDINVPPAVVSRSVGAVARDIRVHPVRDYLGAIQWDGTPRLETWAVTYLGAADTRLNRAFGSLWMISAVARIMDPGCQADAMLILEGPQGIRKSTALRTLASTPWFTDELAEVGSKDAAQQLRGVWIIEIAELDAISRAEVSRIKSFLSRSIDHYRPPYGHYVIDVPRQCVFAGTVNPDTYLRDETGNRRFWPVRCGHIDIDALRRDRDQLWAEAAALHARGVTWYLAPDLEQEAQVEQEARYQGDAWDALIDRWLVVAKQQVNHGYAGRDDWRTEEFERPEPLRDVSVGEILQHAIGIEPGRWTRGDQMRIGAYLKTRGWIKYRSGFGGREWRHRMGGQNATADPS